MIVSYNIIDSCRMTDSCKLINFNMYDHWQYEIIDSCNTFKIYNIINL